MNAITLPSSECEPVSVDMSRTIKYSDGKGGASIEAPYYRFCGAGILRDYNGIPQTVPGSTTPLGYLEMDDYDAPAVAVSGPIGFGLAAAAWSQVAGEHTMAGRDVVLALLEDACPSYGWGLHETLCIAEHELQPARDRVAARLATDPDFTAKFAKARAIMTAASVYFPWDRGDGTIPG